MDDVRDQVDAFRRTLPLLSDLKNPAMRARHWERVKNVVGVDFDENSSSFNLEAIYAMELHKLDTEKHTFWWFKPGFNRYAEDINEISNAATMELQIEKGLRAIVDTWSTMQIEMLIYKDRGVYK